MNRIIEKSDRGLLETLQRGRKMSVDELAAALGVTATAVRQRLDRLIAAGAVFREEIRQTRGRPAFVYALTAAGQEFLGNNLTALAKVLWSEILQIEDKAILSQLLDRISRRLAEQWQLSLTGKTDHERLLSLARLLRDNQITAAVETPSDGELPVLKISGCPYPGISGPDQHQICDVEKTMFSQMLGRPVRLTECRCHSAEGCCTFAFATENTN